MREKKIDSDWTTGNESTNFFRITFILGSYNGIQMFVP